MPEAHPIKGAIDIKDIIESVIKTGDVYIIRKHGQPAAVIIDWDHYCELSIKEVENAQTTHSGETS